MFRTDVRLSGRGEFLLSLILFVVLGGLYMYGSHVRHQENPDDKLMPRVSQMVEGTKSVAFEPDRDGNLRLWIDSWASAKRFGISLGIVLLAVLLGINMGLFPIIEAVFYRFISFIDKIPALALLPILFIVFGLGELSKIALIVIGVFPTIALDAFLRAKEVPREQIVKAKTLGATNLEIAYRVVFPQVFPRALDTIRLNFKSMIALLIAGESLAATVGLGYRIFVVRRYLAMDIIIPYVLWMTTLLFAFDALTRLYIQKRYPWINK